MTNKKVLIVGGMGFIGQHLTTQLSYGFDVVIVDSLEVNNIAAFVKDLNNPWRNRYIDYVEERLKVIVSEKVKFYPVDARDYHKLAKVFKIEQPDIVIHLAAVAHASKSEKNPKSTFDHSLRTLENSLDASKGIAKHFIYFSSSMVYGDFNTPVVNEESPTKPINIYGALKLSGELIVKSYSKVLGIPYTIVRPSAVYGPRDVGRRVIQIFIEKVFDNETIIVKGEDDRLDFTYVQDLVSGVQDIIRSDHSYNEIFNLTYGVSRTIGEACRIICEVFNYDNVVIEKRDEGMPKRGTLDVDKARIKLCYRPNYPLEKGIKEYIRWYKSRA